MLLPLFILIYFSIFSGFFLQDIFVGIGTDFWQSSMYISLVDFEYFFISDLSFFFNIDSFFLFNYEFHKYLRQVPLVWVFYFLIIFSFVFSMFNSRYYLFNLKYFSSFFYFVYVFFTQKWLSLNKIFFYTLIDFLFFFSYFIYFFLEKGILEKLGPFGISIVVQKSVKSYSFLLKGLVYHYLGFILLGLFIGIHFIYFSY
jgi:hypothetical protein